MDQPLFYRDDTPAPTASEPQEERRDPAPDASTSTTDDAAASRHLYTLTVDDVAAELLAYELHRDTRTIQHWCKSGKLRAIIDQENGDRYLIDPGSLRDTVTTLLQERDSRGPRHATAPRPRHDDAGAMPRQGGEAKRVVRHMCVRLILLYNLPYQPLEVSWGRSGAALLLQKFEPDLPVLLGTAVLPGQLIQPTLQRLPKPELVARKG